MPDPDTSPVHIAPPRRNDVLVKIETDRRLGHEWDEWDGAPLPNRGDFTTPASRYFLFTAIGLALVHAVAAALVFLLDPRLAALAGPLPRALYIAIAASAALSGAWLGLIGLSYVTGRPPRPYADFFRLAGLPISRIL